MLSALQPRRWSSFAISCWRKCTFFDENCNNILQNEEVIELYVKALKDLINANFNYITMLEIFGAVIRNFVALIKPTKIEIGVYKILQRCDIKVKIMKI